jgi:type IV secretion system protein VirB10
MIRLPWRRDAFAGTRQESPADTGSVRGERGAFTGSALALQSRMSSLLAAGLMTSVGAGMLAWYYAEALSRPAAAHRRPDLSVRESPGEGMALPSFEPPAAGQRVTGLPHAPSPPARMPDLAQSAALQSMATLPASPPLEPPLTRAPGGLPPGYGAPAQFSPRQQAPDRRLSGEVFAQPRQVASPDSAPRGQDAGSFRDAGGPEEARATRSGSDGLERLLHPSVLAATRAQLLPTQHLLLAKGSIIDCTLETAIDSTLPGMTTCITAIDTFSADGTVVLLGRGTKLIGETRGEVQEGQARVFVVWTEARTPAGVVVRLDSPGTDALGRSGLEGEVNRHFWQRFGAAALISTIDGAVQSEVQSSSRGGTVVLDPTASEDVLTDILRSTVGIPPTIRVRNGARIQVLVARDIDFRPVYELDVR